MGFCRGQLDDTPFGTAAYGACHMALGGYGVASRDDETAEGGQGGL